MNNITNCTWAQVTEVWLSANKNLNIFIRCHGDTQHLIESWQGCKYCVSEARINKRITIKTTEITSLDIRLSKYIKKSMCKIFRLILVRQCTQRWTSYNLHNADCTCKYKLKYKDDIKSDTKQLYYTFITSRLTEISSCQNRN